MNSCLKITINSFIVLLSSILVGITFTYIIPQNSSHVYAELALPINEFKLNIENTSPEELALGPDNNLWGTSMQSKILRFSQLGEVTYIANTGVFSHLAAGTDGNMWFTEYVGNKIGKVDMQGNVTEYPLPQAESYPTSITLGPDGNMWFTEYLTFSGRVGKITPDGVISEFTVSYGPHGIAAGKDGNIWYTLFGSGWIGKITPNGIVSEYTLPTGGTAPEDITAGPDGNMWFTEEAGNSIGKITPNGIITEYHIPTPNSFPYDIAAGRDGYLYFTESNANKLGRISVNGVITEYDIPTQNSLPMGITLGPDNEIWFAERVGNTITQVNTEVLAQITPIPTQAPTPTPTPVAPGVLDVPLFKQGIKPYNDTNPVWESDIFDHAVGQFDCGTTMAQCGCSTTSIAMIFKAHGIEKMPDGQPLTPGTLNTWLKNNNGYNRSKGVIWAVASVLSKLAKSQNPNFTYDALEYQRVGVDKNMLRADISSGIPDILEEPGHYIVATKVDNDTFSINDPYYNRTSLASYNNTYLSAGRYVPSHTDLSYITLIVDKDIDISLKNSSGQSVGESYIENTVNDATAEIENPVVTPSVKIITFAKPPSDTYHIKVNSPTAKNFQLDVTLIDQEGNNSAKTFTGVASGSNENSFSIQYDNETVFNSFVNPEITFDKLKADIKSLYSQKQIKTKVAYQVLSAQAIVAENLSSINKKPLATKLSVGALKMFQFTLTVIKTKELTSNAYEILMKDATMLIAMLQGDTGGGSGGGT